jgi:hypothetical protein
MTAGFNFQTALFATHIRDLAAHCAQVLPVDPLRELTPQKQGEE